MKKRIDPKDTHRDLELVRRVLTGDPSATEEFADRLQCVPKILRVLNRRTGGLLSRSEIADLGQDVALIAWRKLGTFEGHVELPAWLYRICLYELSNGKRRKHKTPSSLEELRESQGESVSGISTPRDPFEHEGVHLALDRIGRVEAHIIRLKHFDGLSFSEIAGRETIAISTVKDRYYRGVSELKPLLEREQSGS